MSLSVRLACAWMLFAFLAAYPISVFAQAPEFLPLSDPRFHHDLPLADPDWSTLVELYRAGKLEEALELLEPLAAGPEPEAWLRQRAVIYKDLGRDEEALADYRRLAALRPEDLDVQLDLAWALFRTGRHGEAAEAFAGLLSRRPTAWGHLGQGLTLWAQGDLLGASASLAQAIFADPHLVPASYFLGQILEERGALSEAAVAYARVMRYDAGYSHLHMTLARLYEEQGLVDEAWRRYRQARIIQPQNQEAVAGMERIGAAHPWVPEEHSRREAVAREAVRHQTVEPAEGAAGLQRIRVGLFEGAGAISFSAGGPFTVRSVESGERLATANQSGRWRVAHNGGLQIFDPSGRLWLQTSGGVRLETLDPRHTFIAYDLEFGTGYFWARKEHRQYRGVFEFLPFPRGITLVNELDIESYLYSVVPSEVYPGMPEAALETQAIAARTYTLRNLGRYRSRGFDVMGSVLSSAYAGVAREHPRTTRAVDATRGLVLMHGGSLIEALYSSNSGGHTAGPEHVWGGSPRAYLRPRLDSRDEGAPAFPLGPRALEQWIKQLPAVFGGDTEYGSRSNFRWTRVVDAADVKARAGVGDVLAVIARERSVGGHAARVEIIGSQGRTEVRGDSIRSYFGGLRSNLFKVEAVYGESGLPRFFLFHGGGFGHGVGLDQTGAAGMAEAGYSAEEILRHYYGPVEIVRAY